MEKLWHTDVDTDHWEGLRMVWFKQVIAIHNYLENYVKIRFKIVAKLLLVKIHLDVEFCTLILVENVIEQRSEESETFMAKFLLCDLEQVKDFHFKFTSE